ncbi:MAG: hypothetical protein IKT97_05655, partial [Spirochaetia bacterium]|nr:hypothetical protein [Spirochaetia bacterium]
MVTSTTEKRGVVFTFLSELLFNSKILCKFATDNLKHIVMADSKSIILVQSFIKEKLGGDIR